MTLCVVGVIVKVVSPKKGGDAMKIIKVLLFIIIVALLVIVNTVTTY